MPGLRAAIVGGSGYGGGELLRLLDGHPDVEVVAATSRKHADRPVYAAHPNLLGSMDLKFTDRPAEQIAPEADVLFFALPHGEGASRMAAVLDAAPDVRVIDLSGDFRLPIAADWEGAYGRKHPAPDLVGEFTYGLPEMNRDGIREARRVANPGCFATGSILALLPLAEKGLLHGHVVSNGVTGSSGSGAEAKATTHHPERSGNFRAYRALSHQHAPEIAMALSAAGADGFELAMVAHSAPMVRGIFTTAYVFPEEPIERERLNHMYMTRYSQEPFVRGHGSTTPEVAVVAVTNYCDVHTTATEDGRQVVVTSAIDNLVKGMAGQAVQNMNLMLGLPETTGLGFPGTHP